MNIKTDDRGIEYVEHATVDTLPDGWALCGTCGRAWNDEKSTSWTPTPSGRCPFEYDHDYSHHDDGRTDMDDVLSLWLDGAPVIVSTYNPNGRSVLDTAEKIDTATLPRVELLHALYTTDLGGGPVTDSDSFAVDAIADVLIWAAHRNGWTENYGNVQDLAARAVAHALGDLTDAREARS